MSQQQMIMTLVAETSIHAGSGESDGIIDLPVQRESHTGWPCLFGSAVKGALRATAEARMTDLARSGIDLPLGDTWKTLASDDVQAQVSRRRHQVLYLEEYAFDEDEVTQTALTSALSQLLGDDLTDEIQAQLTVVGDDHFAHLARASVPVNPHIAID